jgi:peptidoglycan/LPS O-acetylase OafA/YrhL
VRPTYWPSLDGVRALAVAAVVLFHGGVAVLPGGFLGVDAFFVLSGFLITSLLLGEHDGSGRIRLAAFWGRRARRLLPALLVVLATTTIIGRYLLPPVEDRLLRWDALAALGYLANWRMIYRGADYFAQTAAPSPLQHTWSLGIEEQFYLLWPLIVVVALAVRRGRRVLLAVSLLGAAGSAVAQALLYRPGDVNRDYFGTDTRAQALLIGCALGIWLASRQPRPGRHPVLGTGAVLGVLGTAWLWTHASGTDAWLYRGGLTAAAVAVAAVLDHAVSSPASPTARLLALPPLVWLGRISYGVYLWHWPLFAYLTADRTRLTGPALLGVRCGLTLALATVSYLAIERPIRRHALPRRVSLGAALLAAGATAVVVVLATAPAPLPPVRPVVALPVPSASPSPARSEPPARNEPMTRPGRRPGAEPRVDIFGDSVAWTIGTYLPPHPGIVVTTRAIEGCGITLLPDILEMGTPHTLYPYCPGWPGRWANGVTADDPDVSVLLLNRWELMDANLDGSYQHVGQPAFDAYLTGQLDRAVGIAGGRGARVVLLTAAYTRRAERPDGGLYPEDQQARVDAWNALLRQETARHPGTVSVLDLNRLVCPGGTFTWDVDGIQVRSDGLHFTPAGVQQVIAPWLLPRLAQLIGAT